MNVFPDVLKFGALNDRGAEIRRGVSEAYEQLATGRKSRENIIRDTNGRLGEAHLALRDLQRIEQKQTSFSQGLGRASLIANSLDLIVETVGALPEEIQAANGRDDAEALRLRAVQAESNLESVVSALNLQQGRRFLFSGDAVTTAPLPSAEEILTAVETAIGAATTAADVETALDAFFADGGDFDTTLYQGGAGTAAGVEIAEGDIVTVEIKANDAGIKDMIRGLALTALLDDVALADAAEDDALVADAAAALVSGLDSSATLVANAGLAANRIELAQSQIAAQQSVLSEAYNVYAGIDPYETATRAQELEIQLQTVYNVTSRLAGLSFNNFLR